MSRSMSGELAAYLQHRVKEWVRSGKTAKELAEAAHVSTATVSVLQNTGTGVGWITAEGLAKAFGMTMPELMEAARVWSAARPPGAPASPGEELYPLRAGAVELAREDGVSDAAIASVLGEDVQPADAGRSRLWWAMRMKRRELDLAEHEGPRRRRVDPARGSKKRAQDDG